MSITSAMGAVVNNGKVLVLRDRRGRDTLAGGQIDKGEKPSKAAFREIHEETGLKVKILKKIWAKTSTYGRKGKKRAKVFLAKVSKKAAKRIKLSYEHVKFAWLSFKKAVKTLIPRHAKAVRQLAY